MIIRDIQNFEEICQAFAVQLSECSDDEYDYFIRCLAPIFTAITERAKERDI